MKKALIALIFGWLIGGPILLPDPSLAAQPPVLAFYYAWFDDNTWSSGQTLDTPLQPYRSTDPAAIERHVRQARDAGLTALVQSWYGPQVDFNQTETNFRLLLDISAQQGFQAAVDVEVYSPFFNNLGDVQNALATLLSTHTQHPAYYRYNGKPVVFFWKQERFSVADWAAVRAAVDPNRSTYWIAEGVDLAYLDVFDGHHLYNIAWAGDVYAEANKWPPRIRQAEERLGVDKLWIATAMPGFDETHLNRAHQNYRARQNGQFLRESFAAAAASQPDMIVITSFNEWIEGSHIEPSVAYGDYYLNLTRELITGLPAATIPPPEPPTPPPPTAPAPTNDLAAVAPPSDVAPAITIDPNSNTYTVQPGDTFYAIAFGLNLDPQTLIALNQLDDPGRLAVGQVLQLPPAANEEIIYNDPVGNGPYRFE